MAPLIGANRNPISIFLNSSPDNLSDRSVMPKVHNLSPVGLQQATNNVDGGIMPIKKRSSANKPQLAAASTRRRTRFFFWSVHQVPSPYYQVSQAAPLLVGMPLKN
jgi:hypothetical protein